jgi:hypothetical protein
VRELVQLKCLVSCRSGDCCADARYARAWACDTGIVVCKRMSVSVRPCLCDVCVCLVPMSSSLCARMRASSHARVRTCQCVRTGRGLHRCAQRDVKRTRGGALRVARRASVCVTFARACLRHGRGMLYGGNQCNIKRRRGWRRGMEWGATCERRSGPTAINERCVRHCVPIRV